MVNLMMA